MMLDTDHNYSAAGMQPQHAMMASTENCLIYTGKKSLSHNIPIDGNETLPTGLEERINMKIWRNLLIKVNQFHHVTSTSL